jgi:hypothetical protein
MISSFSVKLAKIYQKPHEYKNHDKNLQNLDFFNNFRKFDFFFHNPSIKKLWGKHFLRSPEMFTLRGSTVIF